MQTTIFKAMLIALLSFLSLASSALAGRKLKAHLPQAVQFSLHRDSEPDRNGLFSCKAVVKAPVCDVKLKLTVVPAQGIKVVERPKKLQGRLKKGRTVTFSFIARLDKNAKLPVALRMELHYRASPKGLYKHVSAGEGKFAFPEIRQRTLAAIAGLANERKIERLFDCVLFTKNAD